MEESIYQWALASRELSERWGLMDVEPLPALIGIWLALEVVHELTLWFQLWKDRRRK